LEIRRAAGKTENISLKLGEIPVTLPERFPEESSKKQALVPPKGVGEPKPIDDFLKKGLPKKKAEPDQAPEAKKDASEKKPVEKGLLNRKIGELAHDYWVYVPENYDPNISHGLIVWLHPAGVEGKDAKDITQIWRTVCEEFNFIMLGPITRNRDGWIPSETELIVQDMRAVMAQYTIDRFRIAVHGNGVGGQMAYYVGFTERDLVRGVATVGSVLGTAPKDNLPTQRLSFFIAAGQKDPSLKEIVESREKLLKKKYAVVYREMEALGRQYIFEDEAAIRDLVRWFESLDKI
jgi:serine protease Do